jgi:DNA-binding CsgD family transcriptional regulator
MSGSRADRFVGRDGELAQLSGYLTDLVGGRGRSVWVDGEPGIGKSALLMAGFAGARERGCLVFWAAADEAGRHFPLRVLLDGLRGSEGAGSSYYQQVAVLLRGEDQHSGAMPADAAAISAERLLDVVERICVTSPVLLVADDLQWADDLSLWVWRRLHRLVNQLPLLLVGACRPVPTRAEVAALQRGMAEERAVCLTLGALAPAHVRDMVAGLVGAPPGPRLLERAALAGGNPLYIRELVDALLRQGAVRGAAGAAELVNPTDAGGPPSLAAAISGRLTFLTDKAIQTLRVAALLGGEFSVEELVVVTGRPATELASVVDEAVAAGVIADAGTGLVFRHGLIRQALYETMSPSLRSALHLQAAKTLVAAGVPAERVAGQLLAAQAVDGWVVGWVADAALALTYRAPRIAVDLLTRVRDAIHDDDLRRERVQAGLATALFMLARYDDVEPVARSVLASTTNAQVAGRITWVLGYSLHRMARHASALEVLDRALREASLPDVWRARAQALRAMALLSSEHPGEAEVAATRAEADGARAGDRVAIGFALHARSILRGRSGDNQAGLSAIEQALAAIGPEPETTDLRVLLMANRVTALTSMGRPAEANRAIGHALWQAEQAGNPPSLANIRLNAAEYWYLTGRWDDAVAELAAAAELALPPIMRLWRHGVLSLIASHRDDQPAMHEHVRAVQDLDLSAGDLHYHSKEMLAAQAVEAERHGQPERAFEIMLSVVDMIYPGTGDHGDMGDVWLPDVVRLAQAVGDHETARGATEAAVALAERAHGSPRGAAVAQHCRGLLAADATLVLAAAETYETLMYRLDRARALENAAALLARQDGMAAARSAYTDALAIYIGMDAAWDIRRADARLRPLGLQRGARRRPSTGWEALTPSELTIAGLVAAGRSNPDIAAELFLSRRTVQTHVSHILAKLGAHSRVDIARTALSRDLKGDVGAKDGG